MNLNADETDRLVDQLSARVIESATAGVAAIRADLNIGYLGVDELAELIQCKRNQRSKMIKWLTANRWNFEVSSAAVPRVARAYHDRKMGITDGPANSKFADEPNYDAVKGRHKRPAD